MSTHADTIARPSRTVAQRSGATRITAAALMAGGVALWTLRTAAVTVIAPAPTLDAAALSAAVALFVGGFIVARRAGLLAGFVGSLALVLLTALALTLYMVGLGIASFGLGWPIVVAALIGAVLSYLTVHAFTAPRD